MKKTVDDMGKTCYLLNEDEFCEYQCLKERLKDWNKFLVDAKELLKH